METRGLVHIYCGDGKGKTSAAMGLALRAAGRGMKVVVARFLKSEDSGEVQSLRTVPGITVIPCEKSFGFTFQMGETAKREAKEYYGGLFLRAAGAAADGCEAGGGIARAADACGGSPGSGAGVKTAACPACLLVLDEIMAAVNSGMVEEKAVAEFLKNRPADLEVVMTGRDPSEKLLCLADYVSEIKKIKHPYDRGILARKGIEY